MVRIDIVRADCTAVEGRLRYPIDCLISIVLSCRIARMEVPMSALPRVVGWIVLVAVWLWPPPAYAKVIPDLLVGSGDDALLSPVMRYDGSTGALIGQFTSGGNPSAQLC